MASPCRCRSAFVAPTACVALCAFLTSGTGCSQRQGCLAREVSYVEFVYDAELGDAYDVELAFDTTDVSLRCRLGGGGGLEVVGGILGEYDEETIAQCTPLNFFVLAEPELIDIQISDGSVSSSFRGSPEYVLGGLCTEDVRTATIKLHFEAGDPR